MKTREKPRAIVAIKVRGGVIEWHASVQDVDQPTLRHAHGEVELKFHEKFDPKDDMVVVQCIPPEEGEWLHVPTVQIPEWYHLYDRFSLRFYRVLKGIPMSEQRMEPWNGRDFDLVVYRSPGGVLRT